MLLEVVTFARDVGSDFYTIRETDTGDLADSRVWLAGGLGRDACADTALEGRIEEGWAIFERIETTTECSGLGLVDALGASLSYELTDCCHEFLQKTRFSALRHSTISLSLKQETGAEAPVNH